MAQLNDAIQSNLAIVVAVFALLYLLLLVALLLQRRRAGKLRARLDALTRGAEGRGLESVLSAHLDTVLRVATDLDEVRARTTALERALPLDLQRVGLIRFNPFEDTGGNQSFALALLNAEDTGVVVSSLHSRTGTRVYAKEIRAGKCETALSAEEVRAVEAAQKGSLVSVTRAAAVQARPSPIREPARAVGAAPAARSAAPRGSGEQIDAGFLDRRLRGEDDLSAPNWGDRARS